MRGAADVARNPADMTARRSPASIIALGLLALLLLAEGLALGLAELAFFAGRMGGVDTDRVVRTATRLWLIVQVGIGLDRCAAFLLPLGR